MKKFRRIETDYVAIGIIAACLIFIGAFEMISPSKVIQRAINHSIAEYSVRETANTPWLDESLDDVIKEGDISADVALNITEGKYKDAGFSLKTDRSDSKKMAQTKFDLNYNGTAALTLNAYADSENAVLSVPVLYDKNIKLNINDLTKRIYDAAGIQYDSESTDENIFFNPKIEDSTYPYMLENIKKGAAVSHKVAWNSISNNIDCVSLPKSEVNGLNCKGYEIRISGEDAKAYFTALAEQLFNNTDFKNGTSAYFENIYNKNMFMFQMYYGIATPQDFSNYMLEGYKSLFDQFINNVDFDETSIQVFINNGKLISGKIGVPVLSGGQQLDLNIDVDFNGKNVPTDNLNVSFGAVSQGEQIKFMFSDTNNVEGSKCTTGKTITIDNPDSTNKLSLVTTYDNADNNFTATATVEANDVEVIKANANGVVKTENGYVTADMDNISFTDGEVNMSANGHLYIQKLNNEITPIDGADAVDILNADDEQMQQIQKTISENLEKIITMFVGQ